MPSLRNPANQPSPGGLPPLPSIPAFAGALGLQTSTGDVATFWNAHAHSGDFSHPTRKDQATLLTSPAGTKRFIGLTPADVTLGTNDALQAAITFCVANSLDGIQWGDETTQNVLRLNGGWVQITPGVNATSLFTAINNTQTTFSVASPTSYGGQTGFQASTPVCIQVDSEQMIVGTYNGGAQGPTNNWGAIQRGVNGTVAASHAISASVSMLYIDIGLNAVVASVHGSGLKVLYGPLGAVLQNTIDALLPYTLAQVLNANGAASPAGSAGNPDGIYWQTQRLQDPSSQAGGVSGAYLAAIAKYGPKIRAAAVAASSASVPGGSMGVYYQVQSYDYRNQLPYTDPNYVISVIDGISGDLAAGDVPNMITIFYNQAGVPLMESTFAHYRP